MGILENDVTAILADAKALGAAVSVAVGATTVNGIRDDQDLVHPGFEGVAVVDRERSVLVKTGALASLANDAAITVDGTAYSVRRFEREPPDGLLTRIWFA